MTQFVFINKDAEWLDELGQTFLDDGDLQTGARLRALALQYQQLDERALTLASSGEYAAGRQSVYHELARKSNLPPEFHAKSTKVFVDPAKVRKMPAGKTSAQLQAENLVKAVAERKKAELKEKFAGLSGLKLNLTGLKPKVQSDE